MYPRRACVSFLVALSLVLAAYPAAAQPVSIVTDTNGITAYEMYQNGLHYFYSVPPHPATIRLVSYLTGSTPRVDNLYMNGGWGPNIIKQVTRDSQYVYYFDGNNHLNRLAVMARQGTDWPTDLPTTVTVEQDMPPVTCWNTFLIYGDTSAAYTQTYVKLCNVTGGDGHTLATITGVDPILQIIAYRYRDTTPERVEHNAVFFRTTANILYRLNLDSSTPVQLAANVLDFTLQRLADGSDHIFAVQIYVPGDPPTLLPGPGDQDQVIRISADSSGGGATFMYLATTLNGNIISSLCADANYVFWTEVSGAPTAEIKRKAADNSGSVDTLQSVTDRAFSNIRSDGYYIYFITRQTAQADAIQRYLGGAPALQLDLAAVELEAIQTVQTLDLGSLVKLATAKPTFVRGYANVVTNQLAISGFRPYAKLRGWFDGVEFSDSPIYPLNNPIVDANTGPANTRPDKNRSFFFHLPPAWVSQPGTLRLDMTINPSGAVPETDSRANNTISNTYNIVQKTARCLVFIPVRLQGAGEVGPTMPRFGNLIQRTQSLLPFEGYRLFQQTDDIAKYVFPWNYEGYDFSSSLDQWRALLSIYARNAMSSSPSGCPTTYYIGICDPAMTASFNGLGLAWLKALLFRAETGTNSFAPNSPLGGRTLAHEMGHNVGLFHVHNSTACSGQEPDGPYATYPWDRCTLGPDDPLQWWGFDPLTQRVIAPYEVGDLMSYANNRWISSYTWDNFFTAFFSDPASADQLMSANPDAVRILGGLPQILVTGFIFPSAGTGEISPCYSFPIGAAPIEKVLQSFLASRSALQGGGSSYTLQLLDAAGGLISETAIDPSFLGDSFSDTLIFSQYIPLDPAATQIRLAQGATQFAQRVASQNAPTVTLNPLVINAADQTIAVTWNASDADNDPLVFAVQYSSDNGANYQTLRHDIPSLGCMLDTTMLHGSTQAVIRIIASDGFLTGFAASPTFTLSSHAPTASISGVTPGERIPFGATRTLFGMTLDAEDGSVASENTTWTLSLNTLPIRLQSGGSEFPLEDLEPGAYSLALSAIDSDGNTGSASAAFEISPVIIPEAASAPTLDGFVGDDAYASGTAFRLPLGDGTYVSVVLVHANNKLYVAISGLKYKAGTSDGTFAGISIDRNNSGDLVAQADDVAYLINEYGQAFQAMGDGSGGVPTSMNPPSGYAAAIHRGDYEWSAELEIDDTLLGGWDHAARIKFSEYWLAGTGDDRNWPAFSFYNMPWTWAPAYFGATPPAPANRAPVAVAGPNQNLSVRAAAQVFLDGSGSYDPDGEVPLYYTWSQVEGPVAPLSNSFVAHPSFTVPRPAAAATYRFELLVGDGTLNSASPASVTVRVSPQPSSVTPAMLLDYLLGRTTLTAQQVNEADFNADGLLNIADWLFGR
ncbi:MAG: hypothetical protein NTX50_00490 [Candidatus Sumerlaeota bacterium]|nr:hypothetical protein [Candidatus Sumerlaeota bacterium]